MAGAVACETFAQDRLVVIAPPGHPLVPQPGERPEDGEGPSCRFFDTLAHAFVGDRKSTRLNSSHQIISYAVFCLKKKKMKDKNIFFASLIQRDGVIAQLRKLGSRVM